MTGPERDPDDPYGTDAKDAQADEREDHSESDESLGNEEPGSTRRGLARFGDISFVDPDEDDPGEPGENERRRNGRVLTIAIAVGGAFVLIIGIVGVIAVRGYLDDTSSVTARMSVKYHAQYRSCLVHGGERGLCATRAEAACATDEGWSGDSHRLDDIADICLFGGDAVR